MGGEEILHRRTLVRLHVDDEAVRRIIRQARTPARHQIDAHEGEQQQGHAAQTECNDLQGIGAAVARQVDEGMATEVRQFRQCAHQP